MERRVEADIGPRFCWGLVVAFVLLWPAVGLGADWGEVFEAASVEQKVEVGGQKVMVAAAGGHAEVEAAADQLGAALREGSARMVIGDEALGDLSETSDEEIVAKAKAQPVDRIAIVRVYPGAGGGEPSAVVTVYDKSGEAVGSMAATPGGGADMSEADPESDPAETEASSASAESSERSEPEAESATEKPGAGVSTKAAESVAEVQEEAQRDLEARRKEFLETYIGIVQTDIVSGYTGQTTNRNIDFFEGKYQEELSDEAFYERVADGRYLEEFREKRKNQQGLLVGGILIGTAGTIAMLAGGLSSGGGNGVTASEPAWMVGGGLVATGGMTMVFASAFMTPHPIEPSKMRRLADQYNQNLKDRLDLSEEVSLPASTSRRKSQSQGFGLGVGFSF